MHSKDHWIIYNAYSKGAIIVDEGAKNALLDRKSLLPKGIQKIEGEFKEGSVVFLSTINNIPFAKGITNYNSNEISNVIGLHTDDAKQILKNSKDEIIHANSIVLIDGEEYGKIK